MSNDDVIFKNSGVSIEKDQLLSGYNISIKDKKVPIGIATPLTRGFRHNESLFKMHFDLFDQIDDNLKNLLMTKKGERLGFTSYGTNLVKIFSSTNVSKEKIEEIAMDEIRNSVTTYMPFLNLLEFSIIEKKDLSNKKETVYELIISYMIPNLDRNKKRSISLNLRTSN